MTPAAVDAPASGLADIQRRIQTITSLTRPVRASSSPTSSAGVSSFDSVLRSVMPDQRTSTTDPTDIAKQYLGVPYRWGGTDPSTGLDCSGLVQLVYRQAGVELPRVAADQARAGEPVANLAAARPGDLVFFGTPVDHVGIYVGNGNMIAAPHTGAVVRVQPVPGPPTAIRRVTSQAAMPQNMYAEQFAAAGAKYGVDPSLLAAVARAESGFDPSAVSPAGALGLMQIMPSTAAGLGVDPMNPTQAIDGAARLLSRNIEQFGSVPLALAAYNAGGGAVAKYGGIPPYPETQRYVQKVLGYLNPTMGDAA